MSRVVILRPEPGASATLARATAAGIDAVAVPLFEIVALPWDAPDADAFGALLLTSANAVRHGGDGIERVRHLPAYCVGEPTAAAAREAGLVIAAIGGSDVAALELHLPPGLRLLHLTGRNHRSVEGAEAVHVYESRAIEPPPSLAALAGGVAMVHSPRAGARLAGLVDRRGDIAIAAISAAAAAACGTGWRALASIQTPGDGALLALAAALCQKH